MQLLSLLFGKKVENEFDELCDSLEQCDEDNTFSKVEEEET